MKNVETNQTQRSEEINWTGREKQLAERYMVEPKLVRLLTELAQEEKANGQVISQTEQQIAERYGVKPEEVRYLGNLCSDLFKRILQGQAAQETEIVEPESKELGPEDRTQAVVKQWLLERDYTTKLAVILCAEYMLADHGTEELAREIMSKYENDILAVAEDPEKQPNGISVKEIFLSGVVAEALLASQLI